MALTHSISQFVLKVHSRCNLACDHCYVYEHSDQSWRTRPVGVSPAVVHRAAVRIAEHAAEHRLPVVHVVLHGGEPLLLGPDALGEVLETLHRVIGPVAEADLRLHTNAVLLSPEFCDLFARHDVKVGVSLDGDRAANDLHRNFADGRSSHAAVLRGLALLRRPEYRRQYAGILCTVDTAGDPVAVLDALLDQEPPRIDFLLPHATWDHPPPRPPGRPDAYARWLAAVFDRWVALGRPVPVRLFESIEAVAVGAASGTEGIGLDPVDLLVIETGGEWEQVDSLKTAYAGAPMLTLTAGVGPAAVLNVFEHSADEAAAHPAVAARQHGAAELSDTCRACALVERCGGGHYAHRYRTGSGFRNPSVYCDDLKTLITHIGVPDRVRVADPAPAAAGPPVFAHFGLPDVAAIAEGPVDRERAARIAWTQAEITRAYIFTVGRLAAASRSTPAEQSAADGYELLCAVDRAAPDAAAAVLDHPFARAWGMRCHRRVTAGEPLSAADGAYLSALALAAALRGKVDAALTLPSGGPIHLPTLGTLVRGDGIGADTGTGRTALLHVRAGEIDPSTTDIRAWRPSSWTGQDGGDDGSDGGGILLEDQDPHRDVYGHAVTGRLSHTALARWRWMLPESLEVLGRWAPRYAEQVRSCVRAVVPLVPDPSGAERGETSAEAFGAVAVALPETPDALAMLLVHECQHLLLNTVLDTHDLYRQEDPRGFPVGWRADSRPIHGVLQGAFAHSALAELWLARGAVNPAESGKAYDTASCYAAWSLEALDRLVSCGALLPLGVSFADRLSGRTRRLLES